MFRLNLGLCFFFHPKSRGKKKTRKSPPTYLFLQTTVTFICFSTKKNNYTPLITGENFWKENCQSEPPLYASVNSPPIHNYLSLLFNNRSSLWPPLSKTWALFGTYMAQTSWTIPRSPFSPMTVIQIDSVAHQTRNTLNCLGAKTFVFWSFLKFY